MKRVVDESQRRKGRAVVEGGGMFLMRALKNKLLFVDDVVTGYRFIELLKVIVTRIFSFTI